MAINTGDSITAADYNALQSRVAQVLGKGAGNFGYGQQVTSSQVSGPSEIGTTDAGNITALEFNKIREDIRKIYTHQTGLKLEIGFYQGTGGPPDFETEDNADVIGANQTAKFVLVDDQGNYSYVDANESNGFNDLIAIVNQIETDNRFTINSTQQEIEVITDDFRNSTWNGTIISEFDIEFSTIDTRRYFFNAGGQLRFDGTVSNVSSQRGTFWNDLIENPGEIQFGYNYTQNTGSTSGISFPNGIIGNYDLTTSYQTILRKDASSGLYSNSYWQIQARNSSEKSIRFKIELINQGPESDSDAGSPGSIAEGITESVRADIEFEYSVRRAGGTVITEAPSIDFINRFE